MLHTPPDYVADSSERLQKVLALGLQLAAEEITGFAARGIVSSTDIRSAWIRSLRRAFWKNYRDCNEPGKIRVWGGTPGAGEPKEKGAPSGIASWHRWEFMYDVTVVRTTTIPAAYAKDSKNPSLPRPLPVIERAIWLVESEVADDGTEVVKDSSKLRIGRSDHKLLIAMQTGHKDRNKWLQFLGKSLEAVEGDVFLAIMPTYASDTSDVKDWLNHNVEILLYRCAPDGSTPEQIASVRAMPPIP